MNKNQLVNSKVEMISSTSGKILIFEARDVLHSSKITSCGE